MHVYLVPWQGAYEHFIAFFNCVLYSQNIFAFLPAALMSEVLNFLKIFLSHVSDYIEPMTAFIAWAKKIIPLNISAMQR